MVSLKAEIQKKTAIVKEREEHKEYTTKKEKNRNAGLE